MKRKMDIVALLAIFHFFMSSCAATPLNVWKDDNYQAKPFKKVFVMVALTDPSIQNSFESEFVKQLRVHGTDCEASSDFFSFHFTSDKESMVEKIKELTADAILVVTLVKMEEGEDQDFLPSWYHDWYNYYSRSVAYVRTPKYKDENYLVMMEANMYDTENQRLIWFARSETLMVACNCQEIMPIIKAIVNRLSADKLIK